MGKEVFGEYAAFVSNGGVRFQKNNKLVSEKAIPPEVSSYLKNKLETQPKGDSEPAEATFPRPTDEQLAKMREESLKVPDELCTELTDDQLEKIGNILLPPAPIDVPMDIDSDPNYMETISIYTADIKDIAQALYDRFGVYTIYMNTVPQTDEINPITGEAFTRYHQGIAYQALIKARGSNFFNRSPERSMENMTEGRIAHENHVQSVGDLRQPATNLPSSFDYRTSPAANATKQTHYISHEPDPVTGELRAVRREIPQVQQHSGKLNNSVQRFDSNSDEMLVEPQFGQQVIRPDW